MWNQCLKFLSIYNYGHMTTNLEDFLNAYKKYAIFRKINKKMKKKIQGESINYE